MTTEETAADTVVEQSAALQTTERARGAAALPWWRTSTWTQLWLFLAFVALVYLFAPNPSLAITLLIFAVWAASLNLLLGYGGLVSFGHALPFGYGGYAAGLMLLHVSTNAWLALLVATVAMGVLSALVGAICLRRTEVYFAMLTLAFAQLGFFVALQAGGITGGDDGLSNIPTAQLTLPGTTIMLDTFGTPTAFYFAAAAIITAVFALLILFTDSPLGRALEAIRESEERARGCGYNTRFVQLITFTVAGMVAGLAGGMFAMLNNFVGLNPYWLFSGIVLIMAILGGRGSLFGPVLGATVYLLLEFHLSRAFAEWQLIVGAIFVTSVLAFPQGLWGLLRPPPGTRRRFGLAALRRRAGGGGSRVRSDS